MPMELDITPSQHQDASIKVIGVGGGGGNAINNMIAWGLSNVDFIAANTDKQALSRNNANHIIQMGNGLGAGANPEVARKAIEASLDQVKDVLKGSDMVFITAGMGGGTGTGAAPIIAKTARELNSLVVGIVTEPFSWEAKNRLAIAKSGIEELKKYVDALIVIPNDRILKIIDKKTSFTEAYQKVDEVLYNATRGIADIIGCYGMVNVDFADVRTIMKDMGDALMGMGTSSSENCAEEATLEALNSPLLGGVSIKGSKGLLINITAGPKLSMFDVSRAVEIAQKAAGEDVNLIHGVVINEELKDEFRVTIVATGFPANDNQSDEKVEHTDVETTIFGETQKSHTAPAKSKKTEAASPSKPLINIAPPINPTPTIRSRELPQEGPRGERVLRTYDEPAVTRRGSSVITKQSSDIQEKVVSAVNTFSSPSNNEVVSKAMSNTVQTTTVINNTNFLRKLGC